MNTRVRLPHIARGFLLWQLLLTALLTVLFAPPAQATTVPRIDGAVVDQAQSFTATEAETLTTMIEAHQRRTGVQMAILTVRTTHGVPIERYSLSVAQEWGGGSAARDDGVLLVFAIDDRQSRLEVGYGLESRISDSAASNILRSVNPMMRDQRYGDAARGIVEGVIQRTSDLQASAPPVKAPASGSELDSIEVDGIGCLCCCVGGGLIYVYMTWLLNLFGRRNRPTVPVRNRNTYGSQRTYSPRNHYDNHDVYADRENWFDRYQRRSRGRRRRRERERERDRNRNTRYTSTHTTSTRTTSTRTTSTRPATTRKSTTSSSQGGGGSFGGGGASSSW